MCVMSATSMRAASMVKKWKKIIKVDVSLLQILLSLPNYVLLLKEKICSLWEQILSFKSSSYFGSNTTE